MDNFADQIQSSIGEKVSQTAVQALSVIRDSFRLQIDDLLAMVHKCPALLSCSKERLQQNLFSLKAKYSFSSLELKNLVMKVPSITLFSASQLNYQVELVSTLFAFSRVDALRQIYFYPELLYLTKEDAIKQIEMLSEMLDDFGLGVRKIFIEEPRALFLTKEHIETTRKVLMRSFTLSEAEFQCAAKRAPALLIKSEKELEELFNFYYKNYFIKRDFKEIIVECPEFLLLSPEKFNAKVDEISSVFSLNEKKACELIRKCPHLLFLPSVANKVKGFGRLSIGRGFISNYPEICVEPEIGLPIKFIITRLLNLEEDFNVVANQDASLLVSRFMFMQAYNLFEHHDLLLSEEKFAEKYKLDSRTILNTFKPDLEFLQKVCNYYLSLKDKLPHYQNIVFPQFDKLLGYLTSKDEPLFVQGYQIQREQTNETLSHFKARKYLQSLNFQPNEIGFILYKCPALMQRTSSLSKIVLILKKQGLTLDRIMQLILVRPDIFLYSPKDFELLQEEQASFL